MSKTIKKYRMSKTIIKTIKYKINIKNKLLNKKKIN